MPTVTCQQGKKSIKNEIWTLAGQALPLSLCYKIIPITCIHVFMIMSLHVGFLPTTMHACECIHPAVSAIQDERGRACWPSPISHAPYFLPPHPSRGLAGHPTPPILLPPCVSPRPSQLCHLSVWAVWTGKPATSCLQ